MLALPPAVEHRAEPPRPGLDFTAVFASHGPYVLALLQRLGVSRADVEDVAQEVFVTIHRKLPSFEGRSSLKTWVCGICLRKALAHRREMGRQRMRFGARLVREPVHLHDAEAELTQRERAALFERALDQLAPEQRAVFVLYEVEELPMAAIARALECPLFTAYTRLHSARRQMRSYYKRAHARGELA